MSIAGTPERDLPAAQRLKPFSGNGLRNDPNSAVFWSKVLLEQMSVKASWESSGARDNPTSRLRLPTPHARAILVRLAAKVGSGRLIRPLYYVVIVLRSDRAMYVAVITEGHLQFGESAMPSVRELIQRFDVPPPTIALDWYHQIQAVLLRGEDASEPMGPSPSAGPEPQWMWVEVSDDGRLQLGSLETAAARQALSDLKPWIAAPSDKANEDEASEDKASEDVCRAHTSTHRSRNGTALKTSHRNVIAAVSVVSAFVLLCVALACWQSATVESSVLAHPQSDRNPKRDDASPSLHPNSAPEANRALETSQTIADMAFIRSTDFLSGESIEPIPPELARSADKALTRGTLSGMHPTAQLQPPNYETPSSDSAVSSDRSITSQTQTSELEVQPLQTTSVGARAEDAPVLDVMQQVAQALENAAADETTTGGASNSNALVAADSSADAAPDVADALQPGSQQPALELCREMTHHQHELPRGWQRRPRDPHWSISLELGEGFVLEPAAIQELSSRAHSTWRIYDETSKTPRACLIAKIYNRGNRDAGLTWQLRGGAEDLPQLLLPLERKWLDPLKAQLQNAAHAMRGQLETRPSNPGSSVRRLSPQQRRMVADQLELADRLVEVIADVDRLASLLDHEILCHATLRSEPGGRPLLVYGESSQ